MVVFNYATRELTTKVVYYGPGLCGKTTNLQFIYDHLPGGVRGKMLSLATKSDRTLFFDFLPIDLGQIQGMKTKVQLYTVPGQVFYNETRRLVLKGADGVVFVADSQENMIEANRDSFRNLEENLGAQGLSLAELPHVLQFNKQDLPGALPIETLNDQLNKYNAPFYEAIATTGVGVQETLRHITKLVLLKLNERYGEEPAAGASASQAATPTPTPKVEPAPPAAAPAPEPAARKPEPAALDPRPAAVPDSRPAAAPAAAHADLTPPKADPPPTLAIPTMPEAAPQKSNFASAGGTVPAENPPAGATPTAHAATHGDIFQINPPTAAASRPAPSREDDVLDLPAPAAVPAPAGGGETQQLSREQLGDMLAAAAPPAAPTIPELHSPPIDFASPAAPTAPEAAAAVGAKVSALAVAPDDPLFAEEGVEATRLAPGEAQEIQIPVVIGSQRYRLMLRLELGS